MPALNQIARSWALATIAFLPVIGSAQNQRTVTEADMPRLPHLKPQQAVESFELAAGFSIEQVAAEPMVSDPVAACFDEFGRMFVAEMHGYPFSEEPTKLNPVGGGKSKAGIIRLLEDTDGDGRMDRSVAFAEKLSWPTSVCCYNGGLFVLAPAHLYYLKDTTGDGKADLRETVLTGFGRGNVQALTNGLQWGLDNQIYFAAGRNKGNLLHRGKPLFAIKSNDIKFDPRTESFQSVTGGLQFGHTIDNWGTRFVCSNSNHIMQVVYPEGYVSRNPFLVASGPIRSIARDGASARVFRRSPPEPWRIVRQKWRALDKGYRLEITPDGGWEFIPLDPSKKTAGIPTEYPVGFFTSATGITIYRGDAYPETFRNNAFVGDVGGNLIHRKTIDDSKVVYSANRADTGQEIATSSDTWFRPVNFVNAPDGSLYVLDMYRETIEHPHSIPEEIKAFLDLSSGDRKGRIYRLVSPNMQRRDIIKIGNLNDEDLVNQLASSNGWNRDTAQRLIWERQNPNHVLLIEQLLAQTASPLGRLHSLCALAGLNALTVKHIQAGLNDAHPRVRQHAIRLSESLLPESEELILQLASMANDDSEHVRYQLAFTLGETTHSAATKTLTQMCKVPQSEQVVTAILSSVANTAATIAVELIQETSSSPQNDQTGQLLDQLAIIVGSNPNSDQATTLLHAIVNNDANTATQIAFVGLGKGLGRRGSSLEALLNSDSAPPTLRKATQQMFKRLSKEAVSAASSPEARLSAVKILALASDNETANSLGLLLSAATPQSLQLAAVNALAGRDVHEFEAIVLPQWKGLSPSIRSEAAAIFLSTDSGTSRLLNAVQRGLITPSDISRVQKQSLFNHRNKTIRLASRDIFETQQTTTRAKVVADYQQALDFTGDKINGGELFNKHCSTCHQVGHIGSMVAPDLASIKNKSAADLLIAILDPNREALPQYNTYTVITKQGKSTSGIITAETSTSVTFRQAKAKDTVILRSNIEELVATGVSLMPEGLEKDLSMQQLADVIAFVKSISSVASNN